MQVHEFNVVQTAACLVLGHLSHIHMGANEFQESGLIVKIVRVMRRFYHCQYMTFVFSPSFVCTPVDTHMYVNCTHTCMHACMHICTYIYAANAKCTHIHTVHAQTRTHASHVYIHMYTDHLHAVCDLFTRTFRCCSCTHTRFLFTNAGMRGSYFLSISFSLRVYVCLYCFSLSLLFTLSLFLSFPVSECVCAHTLSVCVGACVCRCVCAFSLSLSLFVYLRVCVYVCVCVQLCTLSLSLSVCQCVCVYMCVFVFTLSVSCVCSFSFSFSLFLSPRPTQPHLPPPPSFPLLSLFMIDIVMDLNLQHGQQHESRCAGSLAISSQYTTACLNAEHCRNRHHPSGSVICAA